MQQTKRTKNATQTYKCRPWFHFSYSCKCIFKKDKPITHCKVLKIQALAEYAWVNDCFACFSTYILFQWLKRLSLSNLSRRWTSNLCHMGKFSILSTSLWKNAHPIKSFTLSGYLNKQTQADANQVDITENMHPRQTMILV